MVAPQVSCPPVVSLRYIMYQPPASVWRRRQGEAWGGGGGPGMSRAVFGGSVQPPGGFAEGGHGINNRQLQTQLRILPRSQYSCIVSATCTSVFMQTVFQINSTKMSLQMSTQTMGGGGGGEIQTPGHVSTQEVSFQSATITTASSMLLS